MRGYFAAGHYNMDKEFLSYAEYQKIFPNFPIDEDEFPGLAQAAFDAIDALVINQLILGIRCPEWEKLSTGGDADFVARLQRIVAQQVQVLYHANGLNAITGGADAGKLRVIDGVPFGQFTINALTALLRKYGLMSRLL